MLYALHDAMIGILKGLKVPEEMIGAYREYWNGTLNGHNKNFPCPSCFAAGRHGATLKPQPARGDTHYVQCEECNSIYSYLEEDF